MLFFFIIFLVLKDIKSDFVFDLADGLLVFGDSLPEVIVLGGDVGNSIL